MPAYSYKCSNCGHSLTVFMSVSNKVDIKDCPSCGTEGSCARVLRGSGFHISGDGVYKQGFSEYKPNKDGILFGDKNEEK